MKRKKFNGQLFSRGFSLEYLKKLKIEDLKKFDAELKRKLKGK